MSYLCLRVGLLAGVVFGINWCQRYGRPLYVNKTIAKRGILWIISSLSNVMLTKLLKSLNTDTLLVYHVLWCCRLNDEKHWFLLEPLLLANLVFMTFHAKCQVAYQISKIHWSTNESVHHFIKKSHTAVVYNKQSFIAKIAQYYLSTRIARG